MEFDTTTTAAGFVLLVLIGVGVTWMTPMGQSTVLMMVLPSLVIFGLLALALGVKYGEYRARANR
ncbi:MAG TPA: hypothetical protein VKA37_04490 [Halobacteriales archaeon]|nr:hypothetical protein [Halobacteriales archaeon]